MGRFFSELYDLEIDLTGDDFLISPQLARAQLPAGPSPRTGVLVIEQDDELQLGVYLDPSDRDDPVTLVEEASHLVCLLWHATHDLPVSALILELQSEIDRFLYFCHESGQLSFDCFEIDTWAGWTPKLGSATRSRAGGPIAIAASWLGVLPDAATPPGWPESCAASTGHPPRPSSPADPPPPASEGSVARNPPNPLTFVSFS